MPILQDRLGGPARSKSREASELVPVSRPILPVGRQRYAGGQRFDAVGISAVCDVEDRDASLLVIVAVGGAVGDPSGAVPFIERRLGPLADYRSIGALTTKNWRSTMQRLLPNDCLYSDYFGMLPGAGFVSEQDHVRQEAQLWIPRRSMTWMYWSSDPGWPDWLPH
jgi:hypothetical protein